MSSVVKQLYCCQWCVLLAVFAPWLLASSESESSLLQALARGAGCPEQPYAETARCLFRAWYPNFSWISGFDSANRQEDNVDAKLYGELEPEGIENVLDHIAQMGAPLSADDAFADLGSGVGQVALLVFLTTPVRLVVGIELVAKRHEAALAAHENALQAIAESAGAAESAGGAILSGDRELRFLNGDISDATLWEQWADASVVFTCSTMFPNELLSDLRDLFVENLLPGALVFSLRVWTGFHKDLAPVAVFQAKTSWSRDGLSKIYLYMRVLKPLLMSTLNQAVAESDSTLDDCAQWGLSSGEFATENRVQRFCFIFKLKRSQHAQYGRRLDTDWVSPEL